MKKDQARRLAIAILGAEARERTGLRHWDKYLGDADLRRVETEMMKLGVELQAMAGLPPEGMDWGDFLITVLEEKQASVVLSGVLLRKCEECKSSDHLATCSRYDHAKDAAENSLA